MIDRRHFYRHLSSLLLVSLVSIAWRVHAADKLVGLHSAQVMSQSMLNKRGPVFGRFMRVMAEASRILHTDKPFVYKVLGKYLRVTDTKILDASYQSEIPALEQRLEIRESALQATLDEIAQTDPRANSVKPQELIDRRYLIELEKSGVFGK
jgi:hypothetical protein